MERRMGLSPEARRYITEYTIAGGPRTGRSACLVDEALKFANLALEVQNGEGLRLRGRFNLVSQQLLMFVFGGFRWSSFGKIEKIAKTVK